MELTTEKLSALKTAILTDPSAAALYNAGNDNDLSAYLNEPAAPEFIVWKASVATKEVGEVVSYIAVEAMTDANRGRIDTFYGMNPETINPSRVDVRSYWTNTFSGALGGAGAATREALDALWRRAATRAEKVLATGAGTTASPATLGWEGRIDFGLLDLLRRTA